MKESILKRYPTLSEDDFSLRDDMDGNGIYIDNWKSSEEKPTMEQVNAWVDEDSIIPKPLSTEERLAEAEQMINLFLLGGI
jgi:hypothetical protein